MQAGYPSVNANDLKALMIALGASRVNDDMLQHGALAEGQLCSE